MTTHDVHLKSWPDRPHRAAIRWRTIFVSGAVACVATTTLQSAAVAAPAVDNGGFETGDFASWTTVDKGNGEWKVSKGRTSPVSGFRIPGPPEGAWQAVADQGGPGAHVLYRDIDVGGTPVELHLTLWYRNRVSRFFTPPELRPVKDSRRNQQFRVELISPTAWLRSVAADDILATVLRTRRGDVTKLGPKVFTQDLSAFVGQTVRLRIVEVDNQGNFQAGVDDVQLVDLPSAAPTP
jgi:hypothetical protein